MRPAEGKINEIKNMANKFIVSPAPHVQSAQSTARIMRDVVIALIPALIVSTVVFGANVLWITALSVFCCMLFEYLIQRFLCKGANTLPNFSAVVTGVLLAFNLPASIPWWIVVIGAFVAIAVAKMTFGGLGKNPFNPALVGRVFLLIAYPVQMTSFPMPANGSFDALSGATALAAVKHKLVAADAVGVQDLLLGNMPGSLGEVAAAALLLGTRDYNGAGMALAIAAVEGRAAPWAFLAKILLTALTMGAGYKGGEIVPAFFIGATLGCTVGPWLGLDPGLAAAAGLVALFCSVVNCPVASMFLSVELFGGTRLWLFAIVCGVSYLMSGYYTLYAEQKIIYSKLEKGGD